MLLILNQSFFLIFHQIFILQRGCDSRFTLRNLNKDATTTTIIFGEIIKTKKIKF